MIFSLPASHSPDGMGVRGTGDTPAGTFGDRRVVRGRGIGTKPVADICDQTLSVRSSKFVMLLSLSSSSLPVDPSQRSYAHSCALGAYLGRPQLPPYLGSIVRPRVFRSIPGTAQR